ncbi:MAG: DUF3313 family protein [Phenylobacterium sp.]
MIRRQVIVLALAAAIGAAGANPVMGAKPPTQWDGLMQVPSKKLKLVYLAPDADFRGYKKVMLDPTEVAFQKNWAKDYNSTRTGLSGRVSDAEVQKVVAKSIEVSNDIFAQAMVDAGYPVVTQAGPDVLRVRNGIINISVTAPERNDMGRSHTFSNEAGYATLVVEVRDSMTGALLGRAVDGRVAGDNGSLMRNRVTNRADFRSLVKAWAKHSANGLTELTRRAPGA